jgi:hypothetical protein
MQCIGCLPSYYQLVNVSSGCNASGECAAALRLHTDKRSGLTEALLFLLLLQLLLLAGAPGG